VLLDHAAGTGRGAEVGENRPRAGEAQLEAQLVVDVHERRLGLVDERDRAGAEPG
jgi:hypothetical protein